MALSRQQTTTSIPLSIKEISLQAAQFDFSPNVALQRWIRAAKMLLTEAALCEQDGNLQKAYLYLVRHADLVLERLPHHPDYRDPHFKPDLMEAQRAVQRNFHKLDDWRPGLVQQYERYESAIERWEVEQQRLEQEREASRQRALIPARQSTSSHTYNYPSVPAREEAIDWRAPSLQPSTRRFNGSPPDVPAKDTYDRFTPALPPRPSGPSIPRSPRHPATTTEAGDPLRTLLLPSTLRPTFLNLAHPNTLSNLETCGILAATLASSTLKITHLLLPAQHSTSETCDTTPAGDAALFDYCDAHSLLVCGWIHTHPSQTCFLSSRDLHTSSGYQVMMPEAIAIVCAPRHVPEFGVFRLTAPPGLQAVLGCKDEGVFHPHAEGGLYTDALRPGHVVESGGLEFEVVDLRKG
ncbi:hypothetical protein LTR48_002112 [Friedmanniomyces endolithicus]|uniref:MPN domain-containing protein n=1 Tax=Rachicladosporium monterosium TaxID=1507873 RepID=A0ABR0LC01_9PEZI|nr:hypothetical protein LTR48_002112 [Friedmanniomyces endolithicus]KAK5146570.1 hypothetical protein LTR32_001864 [Rachicladosporium monterosium]